MQGYDLHDPLVGHFSASHLPQHFGLLRARFAVAPVARARELSFALYGPVYPVPGDRWRWYWREAPLLGLIGESQIVVTPRGVASETVAYDLNISSDALRDCGPAAPDRLVALRCPRARAHH